MRPDVGTQAQFRKKKAPATYRTTKDIRDVLRSHLNYVVADTRVWEQSAAYILDTHPAVNAFVKNAGLGFAIPYLHNGQPHDYVPDFIVRLNTSPVVHLILETSQGLCPGLCP